MTTVLPTNFREMVKRDGFPPGNDSEAHARASWAGSIYMAHLVIIIMPTGETSGLLPGFRSKGLVRASLRWGAVAGRLALAVALAPVEGHLDPEEKVAAFLGAAT